MRNVGGSHLSIKREKAKRCLGPGVGEKEAASFKKYLDKNAVIVLILIVAHSNFTRIAGGSGTETRGKKKALWERKH